MQRNVLSCQQCQWGLQMRVERHTLHFSNGQADGRLLCSLCLGWWLYSSRCYTLPTASHQPQFIDLSPLFSPLLYSLSLLFICSFCFSLGLVSCSRCVCLSACKKSNSHSSHNFSCWGREPLAWFLETTVTFSSFLADCGFGYTNICWRQSCSGSSHNLTGLSKISGSWAKQLTWETKK